MKSLNLSNGYTVCQLLGGRCNSFLIVTPKGNLMVDTSVKRKRKKLIASLKRLGVDQPSWLLLTHCHFDHCQNADFLHKYFPGMKTLAGSGAKSLALKGHTRLPDGTTLLTRPLVKVAQLFTMPMKKQFRPFVVDAEVPQYFSMAELGFDIEIVATPGHSSDSVSIIVNNELALVGDTLFGVWRASIFPPFADDIAQLLESWEKLAATGCSLFFPAHGRKIDRERLLRNLQKRKTT